ncbi:MAG: hypothetical protein JOS17DRAFT_761381 [Linnemannia elongata]|nr:MAG: hypothetical protein JOS17DRAFT_761381 [Linnemannia elongata]
MRLGLHCYATPPWTSLTALRMNSGVGAQRLDLLCSFQNFNNNPSPSVEYGTGCKEVYSPAGKPENKESHFMCEPSLVCSCLLSAQSTKPKEKSGHNIRRSPFILFFFSLSLVLSFFHTCLLSSLSLPSHLSTTQKTPAMTIDNPAVVFIVTSNTLVQTESKEGLPT